MNRIKLFSLIIIAVVSAVCIAWYINRYLFRSRADNQSQPYITGLVRHQTFTGGTTASNLADVNDFQLNSAPSSTLYYPLAVRNWTAGGSLRQWSSFELYNPNNNPVSAQVFVYGVAPDTQGSTFTVTVPAKSYLRAQDLTDFNNLVSGYQNGRVFWFKIAVLNSSNGLVGINKWRLVDGTRPNSPIVDTDISNLQTKSAKNWIAPFIIINGNASIQNATQWTDIILVNVTENQTRVRITFYGKIGQNNNVQTKTIEKTIQSFGYYSTYGDQSWYDLFRDSNGQVQSAVGWSRVDVVGGNGEIIGLTRHRVLRGQTYDSPLIFVNDENLTDPISELYVPLAFFGYESGLPDQTQWTDIVIPNLLSETLRLNVEYVPLTGTNLNKSSFSISIEPRGQYISYNRQEWLNFASNGRRYGWVKITAPDHNQAVLTGLARWTLRSGTRATDIVAMISDMVLTSKTQEKVYAPFAVPIQQVSAGALQYEKYNFVTINTSETGILFNLFLAGSSHNFNNLPILSYGLFNSYSNSSLQQINYNGWGEISVLAVRSTNTPTTAPTSFYRTCENNRCVVRTGTPPANRRNCSVDADCISSPTSTPTRPPTSSPTRPAGTSTPTPTSGSSTSTGRFAIGFNRYQVYDWSGNNEVLYDSDDFQLNTDPSSTLYYPLVVRDWPAGGSLKQWSSFELYNPNNNNVSVTFHFYDANINGSERPERFVMDIPANSRLSLDNNSEYQNNWNNLLRDRSNGRLMWAMITTANTNQKIIGINKWRLIDGSRSTKQIVDNEINNLQTTARSAWVVPFVLVKSPSGINNTTQWTDLVIANVSSSSNTVQITFTGKIGSNTSIVTKTLEVNIGPYGYYGTYGDSKWYDLFRGSNGQIQTATGYAIVESYNSKLLVGLARNRIVEGTNYNGRPIAINDVEFSSPTNMLYVPFALFGEPGSIGNTTQWTDVVIPNLSSSRSINLTFEFVPLYGSNLYSKKRFNYTLGPKDVLNTFTLQQWKNFGSNNNKYGWVKITTDTPSQNILTGMSRWALREGSESTGKPIMVSDVALSSDIKSQFYVPYIAPKYDLVYNGQPTNLSEKFYFIIVNTSNTSMEINFNAGGSYYNLGSRTIRSSAFFNSYYDSMFKNLQPPTNARVIKFWLPIHTLLVNQGNQPTATPTNTPYIIPTNTPVNRPTSTPTRPSATNTPVNRPTSTPTRPSATNTPVNQPTSTPSSPPKNIVLTFRIKFQGISNPVVTTLPVNVTVKKAFETGVSKTVTFTYNQQQRVWIGQSSFNLVPSDGYFIYIKGPKHLRKKICDETPTESAGAEGTYVCSGSGLTITNDKVYDFSRITLLAGDLDPQNGVVNSYDWSLVRNSIGTTDQTTIQLADINYDGKVNVQDYTLIMYSLSIKLDEF